jgi:hypothetical protein
VRRRWRWSCPVDLKKGRRPGDATCPGGATGEAEARPRVGRKRKQEEKMEEEKKREGEEEEANGFGRRGGGKVRGCRWSEGERRRIPTVHANDSLK